MPNHNSGHLTPQHVPIDGFLYFSVNGEHAICVVPRSWKNSKQHEKTTRWRLLQAHGYFLQQYYCLDKRLNRQSNGNELQCRLILIFSVALVHYRPKTTNWDFSKIVIKIQQRCALLLWWSARIIFWRRLKPAHGLLDVHSVSGGPHSARWEGPFETIFCNVFNGTSLLSVVWYWQ